MGLDICRIKLFYFIGNFNLLFQLININFVQRKTLSNFQRKWLLISLVARCLCAMLGSYDSLVRSNERNPLFLLPSLRPQPNFNGTIVHRLTTSLKFGVDKKEAFQSNFS